MASLALGIAGAGIGSAFGMPMLGFSLGMTLGGVLFPSRDNAQSRGKLDDLKVTGSSYGAMLPKLYGQARVGGTVIWSTDLVEHVSDVHQGGKGGFGGSVKQYTYTVSCAVAICEGPIHSLTLIQAEDLIIYNSAELEPTKDTIRFYEGTEVQTADSLLSSTITSGECPAFRGTAYVVFENLNLTRWGGRMPSFTFTIQQYDGGDPHTVQTILEDLAGDCAMTSDDYDFSAATDSVPGMIITERQSAKDNTDELLRAYSTDLAEIDGKLVAVRRGNVGASYITLGDLGTYGWSGPQTQPPFRLQTARLQDLELPRQLDYNYLSLDNSFQGGTQTAMAYTHTTVSDSMSVQTNIVLADDDARQIAEKVLWTQFLERDTFTFTLPYKYACFAPGGEFLLPVNGGYTTVRVLSMDIGLFGEIKCTATLVEDETITQTASGGGTGNATPTDVSQVVASTFVVWSGTELQDDDGLFPGFYVAATGPDGWTSASIYYSLDSGSNYLLGGGIGTRSEFGQTTSTLADGVTADALDSSHTVGVSIDVTGTLESSSTTEVATTTTNAAVIGNEIVSYATVTQTGALAYTLSNIYRGRRGSVMTGHTSSDLFVHVTPAVVRVKVPDSAIGTTVKVKVVSSGQSLSDVTAKNVTIPTNNRPYLEPSDRRIAYIMFSDFTPTSTGADNFECPILEDGTWDLIEIIFWCKTPGGSPAFTIEKSTGTGAFSGTTIGSLTVSSGAREAHQTSSLGSVTGGVGGDKIRVNVTALGTATDWTIIVKTQIAS
jgi:hypothetical protein